MMQVNFFVAVVCVAVGPALGGAAEGGSTTTAVTVKNGGMTQGSRIPANWGGENAARDTEVFKSAPASLCVTGKGSGAQRIDGMAGQKVRITGWIKSEGGAKAQAVLHAFAKGFKNNLWQQLVYVQGETEWQRFEKTVTLPEWTAWSELKLVVEGGGRAWLDDVSGTDGQVDPGTPVTAEEEMHSAPPPKGKPWEPAYCIHGWRSAWFGMNKNFAETTKQGKIDVLFYGDSLTMGFGELKQVKNRNPGLNMVNYGIGGDSTRQLLWRISHGEVEGIKPKLVVLMIGTNNLYNDLNAGTDEEIAKGIEAVLKLLREKLPDTRILLMGLLPRENTYFCGRIAKINARISTLDDGKQVRYLDIGEHFITAPGKMNPELYNKDNLHLGLKGYELWAEKMDPLFKELLSGTTR